MALKHNQSRQKHWTQNDNRWLMEVFTIMRPESLLSNTVSECDSNWVSFHYASIRCIKRSRHNVFLTPSRSSLVSFSLNCSYYLQRKRAKPQTAAAAPRQRLGLLSSCEDFLENLLVEGGEDQLVVVDQAAEANGELLQLLADWEQTAGQRRRGLVLTGLQGGQEVALNAGV